MNYKITGTHSHECESLYNKHNPKKKKILDDWDKYKNLCINEFNKIDNYKRSELISIAQKIYNENPYEFKYTENRIKSMIADWKKTSQRFTKYIFFEENKTFDNKDLLQMHIYKKILNKSTNRIIYFESFIWGNDLFIRRLSQSKYIFIDWTFHYPIGFTQLLIIMHYDELIERKIPALFIVMNSKCENSYNEIFKNIKNMINFQDNEYSNNDINKFITITIDNELALNNSLQIHFPNSQRISCYYHFKNNLQKRAR